jgi:ergothioneine biosynthesis protein EgtB
MAFDRSVAVAWYQRNRMRSRALFDLLSEDAYYSQPIALRHPIVFYEGHLPGFSFNTLVKKALGRPSIDARLESLFARGIDPHENGAGEAGRAGGAGEAGRAGGAGEAGRAGGSGGAGGSSAWPSRDVVHAFGEEADRQVIDALMHDELDRPGDALLDRAEAVFTILEHEAMHQETLLYMWHRLAFAQKRTPQHYRPRVDGESPRQEWVAIPGGCATLGVARGAIAFGWDNEHPALGADVAAFSIERHDVTNARYLEFVDAGGYTNPAWWRPGDWDWIQRDAVAHPLFWERQDHGWYWRGMFDLLPLPAAWPVYVSHAEASAYARWRGARLPTEAEFQRAAFGDPERVALRQERQHPWGDAEATAERGVFDFSSWDPEPAGAHPTGSSAWGVEDLVGNGWEWTSTPFAPFPGFRAMASYPEYSADFFDGEHFVMKGASPATARELLRPTFRNWFRARYPYVYATFRCAR